MEDSLAQKGKDTDWLHKNISVISVAGFALVIVLLLAILWTLKASTIPQAVPQTKILEKNLGRLA